MAEVAEADRAKALAAIKASSPEVYVDEFVIDGDLPPLIETVAAALAEEREKARAPFLALADELDLDADDYRDAHTRIALRHTVGRIRQAAEDV
jgi:hypothetical protein